VGKNIANNAQAIADEFATYLKANQDNIAALTISQPAVSQARTQLRPDPPGAGQTQNRQTQTRPLYVWHAYRSWTITKARNR